MAAFVALTGLFTDGYARADSAPAREAAVLVTATGEHRFDVEIADSEEARQRGLMFRRSLGPRQGMLFIYPDEQPVSMWMRNTYISLDMIFIRGDGTVHRIAEGAEPFSERQISSGGRVRAVLEVRAGVAAEIGLRPGDRVRHERLGASGR